jgi:DnaJ-class molecular chaperone
MFGGMFGKMFEQAPQSAIHTCPKCNGLKKIDGNICPTCCGEGVIFEKNSPKAGDSFTK